MLLCLYFSVKPLLGTVQGLKEGQQHPFPWYPPVCNGLSEFPEGPRSYDHLASIRDRAKHSAKLFDPSMEPVSQLSSAPVGLRLVGGPFWIPPPWANSFNPDISTIFSNAFVLNGRHIYIYDISYPIPVPSTGFPLCGRAGIVPHLHAGYWSRISLVPICNYLNYKEFWW